MGFNKNVIETIQKRRSVRSYDSKRSVESEKIEVLEKMMSELSCEAYRFQIATSTSASGENVKLGTYGVIKGAQVYLLGVMNTNSKEGVIGFGRAYEYLILKATELGFGTCWLVGTFDEGAFSASISLAGEERVVMVSPLGYEKKARLKERMLRSILKSSNRQDWEELFYNNSLESPLRKSDVDEGHRNMLEMVRLAPSAANRQPWRVIKSDEGSFHFYMDTKKVYRTKRHHCGYNDLGIAKAHFELAAEANGVKGRWQDVALENLESGRYEYLFSWVEA